MWQSKLFFFFFFKDWEHSISEVALAPFLWKSEVDVEASMAPALTPPPPTSHGLAGCLGVGVKNSTLSPRLGLSHWRKLFHLQASFAKEENVVQRKSSLKSTSCSRGQML